MTMINGTSAYRSGQRLCSTTQIDATLRLSWCTDIQPGPTQYPKHGSRRAATRPGTPRAVSISSRSRA